MASSGYFIDTLDDNPRFGGWTPEAGPFETVEDAERWLAHNRDKLMYPDAETRIIWATVED